MSKEHPNVELLRRFNNWRRGGNGAMPTPAEVGVAIDWAVGVCAAAQGLVAVKGRHHSQQAYERLAEAVKVGADDSLAQQGGRAKDALLATADGETARGKSK